MNDFSILFDIYLKIYVSKYAGSLKYKNKLSSSH